MKKYYFVDLENVKNGGLDGIEQLTPDDNVVVFYSDKADTLKIDVIQKIHEGKAAVKFIKADNGTPNSLDFQLITYLYYHLAKNQAESDGDQFWIISKDTGYEASIRMAKKMGLNNVHRAPAVINAIHYHQRAEKNNALQAQQNLEKAAEQTEEYQYTDADAPEVVEEVPDIDDYDIPAEEDEKENLVPQADLSKETPEQAQIRNLLHEKCGVDLDDSQLDLVVKALAGSENKNQFYQYFRHHMGKEGSDFYKSIRSQYATLKEIGGKSEESAG